ncbi:MAG: ABC transporter substrate-binding protein [Candidatus Levyibacteriota bacterium]
MFVFRRRLIFWLIKAYLRKWGKGIIFFFIAGLVFFFIFRSAIPIILSKIPIGQKESIGLVGAYTNDNLPQEILGEVSSGLTVISPNGTPLPNIAKNWKIEDNGKTYVFDLRKDVFFSDGSNLTSNSVNYNFSDAKVEKPDKYKIIFKLKESYSPFLVTVSRPIFKDNLVGIGNYKIIGIKLNGNFVQSLSMISAKDKLKVKEYLFYPSQDALKIAFNLGEISKAQGLSNLDFDDTSFDSFPNLNIQKNINASLLATLFYNNNDAVLSDKKIRNALSYALPDNLSGGQRNWNMYAQSSWVYSNQFEKSQDIEHAKILMSQAPSASKSSQVELELKTLSGYEKTAQEISKAWELINVKIKIIVVDSVPSSYQIFLGDYKVPKDPDQYSLWHSQQENNITGYKNLRIDKLLEDGRKTIDSSERKKIYLDLQKYLLDDSPASFLFLPYEYEIIRK